MEALSYEPWEYEQSLVFQFLNFCHSLLLW